MDCGLYLCETIHSSGRSSVPSEAVPDPIRALIEPATEINPLLTLSLRMSAEGYRRTYLMENTIHISEKSPFVGVSVRFVFSHEKTGHATRHLLVPFLCRADLLPPIRKPIWQHACRHQ